MSIEEIAESRLKGNDEVIFTSDFKRFLHDKKGAIDYEIKLMSREEKAKMNKYYPLIEELIRIKDKYPLTLSELDAINDACNSLKEEGKKYEDD